MSPEVQLEAAAREGCCTTLAHAQGRCLHATVELARRARGLGLADRVEFIRWKVVHDLDFVEHWALVRPDGLVLDMTAVQVDGDPRPVRRLPDYPAHHVDPRRYPLALVLDALPEAAGERYSRRTLWRLHRRLFRHDLALARSAGSLSCMARAFAALLRSGFILCAGHVLERAIARMSRLLLRLQ